MNMHRWSPRLLLTSYVSPRASRITTNNPPPSSAPFAIRTICAQDRAYLLQVRCNRTVQDEALLDNYCESRSGTKNRFGGYRLVLPRGGRIDVWPLQRTWAFRQGVRRGSSLADLVGTTYFSWDSIVYDLKSGRIHCRNDYVPKIESGIVDIELPDNPYPLGALVRTLRLIASSKANLTSRLARHTLELFQCHSISDIVSAEYRGYTLPWLTETTVTKFRNRLERFVGIASEGSLFHSAEQLPLPFVESKGSS